MGKTLEKFVNQYSVSKTLRFELIPQGKTKEYIEKRGFLLEDELRAERYKKAKKIIDRYHKDFIDTVLSSVTLSNLEDFYNLYNKAEKTESDKKELSKIEEKLRKEIIEKFSKNSSSDIAKKYKNLHKKELITKDLPEWLKNHGEEDEDIEIIHQFNKFTSYFTGFHENRKNIYSTDAHSTSLAYRLINDNLPRFIDNIKAFEIIKTEIDVDNDLDNKLLNYLDNYKPTDFFSLDFYNNCLNQSGFDRYNTLIGGVSEGENSEKIQGLNELINLKNQQIINQNRVEEKDNQRRLLPKLKILYKQILSDSVSTSFNIDAFENDNEVLESIESFYKNSLNHFEEDGKVVSIFDFIRQFLSDFSFYDISKVYIKNDFLKTISNDIYGNWNTIYTSLNDYYDNNYLPKKLTKEALKQKEKWLKRNFSIKEVEKALSDSKIDIVQEVGRDKPIQNYFKELKKNEKGNDLIDKILDKYKSVESILNSDYSNKNLISDKNSKVAIKEFLDSIIDLLHFIKVFDVKSDDEKDSVFYGLFDSVYEKLSSVVHLYNMVRNYLTKKPYSTEKFKLNFDNVTLLNGWDKNKERDNCGVLLKKDGLYYLGIMDKKHNKVFDKYESNANSGEIYEKIVYKLLPGPNKMLPKVFFSKSRIDEFKPSNEILEIYKKGSHKKGDNFNINDCHKLIDFFKSSINKHPDWKQFDFKFSDTKKYNDLSEFYKEVETQGYKITYQKIDSDYIDTLVDEGKLYLFKIYNKDFSSYSKGTPNLHTIYWKMLFDERNLANVVYKLNGEAEVFYRKKSINESDIVVHKANTKISNRQAENGGNYPKTHSIFDYDIIQNRRFTVNKFQFHVPITLNFKAIENKRFNTSVLEYLKDNPDVNIIGLDRGERHLIYLTLINQKGEILKQKSLNIVGPHKINYQKKLDTLEKDRTSARKNWDNIENIKELKSGYLSQVIHEIVELMVENSAIVVMEDLNFGFKRGRTKVEKQVYQKFEKALIDKLNYLVFKKKDVTEVGGALKALQLAPKFETFQKLGKQCGFIFYVSADYTSKIDPTTGFVNLLYPKYENISKSKTFISKFDSIRYNNNEDYFEFETDYINFTNRVEGIDSKWLICSYGDRLVNFRNPEKNSEWDTKEVNLTNEFKNLFSSVSINFENGDDLKAQIIEQEDSKFFKEFFYLLKLTLQMRNSKTGTEVDYLISPVKNSFGKFYDSRDYETKDNAEFPKDADANGAYHIGLKGLKVLQTINSFEDVDKINYKQLAISNKDWFNFVQELKG